MGLIVKAPFIGDIDQGTAGIKAGEPFAAWSAPVTFLGAFVCYRLFTRRQPSPVLTGN